MKKTLCDDCKNNLKVKVHGDKKNDHHLHTNECIYTRRFEFAVECSFHNKRIDMSKIIDNTDISTDDHSDNIKLDHNEMLDVKRGSRMISVPRSKTTRKNG